MNPIAGWKKLILRVLGSSDSSRDRSRRRISSRRPMFEALDDRRMLATYTVNTEVDKFDFVGDRSLREAVFLASSPGDIIDFDPNEVNGAAIELSNVLGEIVIEANGSLTIDASNLSLGLTIDGNDPTPGNPNSTGDGIRIFNITDPTGGTNPPDVTIKGLTLTGGDVAGEGGAIQSVAGLKLENCVIIANAAASNGGGVYFLGRDDAKLEVIASTISGNASGGNGGGIRAYLSGTSSFSLTDATISGRENGSELFTCVTSVP